MTQNRIREWWTHLIRLALGPTSASSGNVDTGFSHATNSESTSRRGQSKHERDGIASLAELLTASAFLGFDATEFLRRHRRLHEDDDHSSIER
jgi:hypothetical protein